MMRREGHTAINKMFMQYQVTTKKVFSGQDPEEFMKTIDCYAMGRFENRQRLMHQRPFL